MFVRILSAFFLSLCLMGCQGYEKQNGPLKAGEDKTRALSAAEDFIGEQTEPLIWNRFFPDGLCLPASYDYRQAGGKLTVGSQGDLNTCWAFAALSAVSAALLPEEAMTFSADHLSLSPSFLSGQEKGGDFALSMAYLLSWAGPVPEEEDPYGDGQRTQGLSACKHVQEILLLPSKDYRAIKEAVYLYGGVQSALYEDMQGKREEGVYYDGTTASYCCTREVKPNHDCVIVGWDDAYPKENFGGLAGQDGAFLCLNSWGEDFGDDGYFFVSYEDASIGVTNIVYTAVEPADNFDAIYQSDLCGWTGQIGYGQESVWYANVYRAKNKEIFCGAGFYTLGQGSHYELYLARHLPEDGEIAILEDPGEREMIAAGELEQAGFYTVRPDSKIVLDPDENFAIIVKVSTPGCEYPAAVECDREDDIVQVDLTDGQGYVSADGLTWENTERTYACNLCLKVYTRREGE